jgi:hypothetical protein
MSVKGLENLRLSAVKNLHSSDFNNFIKIKMKYENEPILCLNCDKPISYEDRNKRKYCNKECLKIHRRKDKDEYLIYKSDASFKFSLNDYPDKFDFSLIEKHGWYSPSNSKKPNINGVSRDHMISIKDGFRFGIDPKLIAHPANCKLMVHSENISKNKNSSITIEELIERINNWGNSLMG